MYGVHGMMNHSRETQKALLHDIATWAVLSQGIQDHFGAKPAYGLAGYLNCQPRFQFPEIKPGRTLERG